MKAQIFLWLLAAGAVAQEKASPQLDGRVWGAVVYASGEGDPAPSAEISEPSETFQALLQRLRKALPEYSRFRLLGEHRGDLYREYESWLVPSRDFFFRLDSGGPLKDQDGLRVNLQVWRKKDVILKTDVALVPGSAVFVGGQKWRKGRIIFLVTLESGRPDK